jgi:L-fucose isomerase-like protein
MPKLALLPFVKINFDYDWAKQLTADFRNQLLSRGFEILGGEDMIRTTDEARAAARALAGEAIDLVVIFQSSFTDNTMVLEVVEEIDAPILLWSLPEPWTGGRLRLNSLCGVNLASHALHRRGIPSFYVLSDIQSDEAYRQLLAVARAGEVRRRLKGTTLALVGDHPEGMDTCEYNPAQLEAIFGVSVRRYDLGQFFNRVRATPAERVEAVHQQLAQKVKNLDTLDPVPLGKTLATYVVLHDMAQEDKFDGMAIRCWPEFFTDLGCSACGALSLAIDGGLPSSCEGDVLGTIGQMILTWLGQQPAYGVDLVGIDPKNNQAALWHCGHAPLSMADPACEPEAIVHLNRSVPLLLQFSLRPGQVTLVRLSQADNSLRLVAGPGEILSGPRPFAGTSGIVRFSRPVEEVLETIMTEGLEHHLSFTYGHYIPELMALAKMLKLPVLSL